MSAKATPSHSRARRKVMLIDGGESGSGALAYLKAHGIKRVDVMVATHPIPTTSAVSWTCLRPFQWGRWSRTASPNDQDL